MDAAVQGIAAAVLAVAGLVDKQVAPVRPCDVLDPSLFTWHSS